METFVFSPISFQSVLKQEEDALMLLKGFAPILNLVLPGKFESMFVKAFISEFEMTYANSIATRNFSVIDKINSSLIRPQNIKNLNQIVSDFNNYVNKLQFCRRQAYVGSYENAFSIYSRLRAKLENRENGFIDSFSLSRETLASTVTSWRFEKVSISSDLLILRIHSFLQSGIMDLWTKWNLRMKTYNGTVLGAKHRKHPIKSLSMHDNVLVIFYLWILSLLSLSLLGLDFFVFGMEVLILVSIKFWRSRNHVNASNAIVINVESI